MLYIYDISLIVITLSNIKLPQDWYKSLYKSQEFSAFNWVN